MAEAKVTADETGRVLEVEANTVVDRHHDLAVQVMPDAHPNESHVVPKDDVVVDKDHPLAVQALEVEPHAALIHLAESPMEALARWERDGYPDNATSNDGHVTDAAAKAHEDRLEHIEAENGTGHPEVPEATPPA